MFPAMEVSRIHCYFDTEKKVHRCCPHLAQKSSWSENLVVVVLAGGDWELRSGWREACFSLYNDLCPLTFKKQCHVLPI